VRKVFKPEDMSVDLLVKSSGFKCEGPAVGRACFADLRLSGVSRIGLWETLVVLRDLLAIMILLIMEVIMITEVNAVNFRQNLGEMLNQVQYRNDSIVINKDGKPVAALVDAELFARIRRMRERFDALSQRIAEAYAEVPVEEGMTEIDAVVARERKS
jgi:prevent-host-death family protein